MSNYRCDLRLAAVCAHRRLPSATCRNLFPLPFHTPPLPSPSPLPPSLHHLVFRSPQQAPLRQSCVWTGYAIILSVYDVIILSRHADLLDSTVTWCQQLQFIAVSSSFHLSSFAYCVISPLLKGRKARPGKLGPTKHTCVRLLNTWLVATNGRTAKRAVAVVSYMLPPCCLPACPCYLPTLTQTSRIVQRKQLNCLLLSAGWWQQSEIISAGRD